MKRLHAQPFLLSFYCGSDPSIISGTSRWMLPVLIPRHAFLTAGRVQGCSKSRPRTNSTGKEIHSHLPNHVCDNLQIQSICKWKMFGIFSAKRFRSQSQATVETEHCALKPAHTDLTCEAKFPWLNLEILTVKSSGKNPRRSCLTFSFAFSMAASRVLVVVRVINGHTWIAWS